jgi:hypothetical protein
MTTKIQLALTHCFIGAFAIALGACSRSESSVKMPEVGTNQSSVQSSSVVTSSASSTSIENLTGAIRLSPSVPIRLAATIGQDTVMSDSFTVRNLGPGPASFSVMDAPAWASISPTGGRLEFGRLATVAVELADCTEQGSELGIVTVISGAGETQTVEITRECYSTASLTIDRLALFDGLVENLYPNYDPLVNNAVIEVPSQGLDELAVAAVRTEQSAIRSIRFDTVTDGLENSIFSSEFYFPSEIDNFFLLGLSDLGTGRHRITATPYSDLTGLGAVGPSVQLEIIVRGPVDLSLNNLAFNAFVTETAAPISVDLLNNSGFSLDYEFQNLPTWLAVNPSSGSITSGETQALVFSSGQCDALSGDSVAIPLVLSDRDPILLNVVRQCGDSSAAYNYTLERFYFNQAVPALDTQTSSTVKVPVVAGRAGIARAFVVANSEAAPPPVVRLVWQDEDGTSGSYELVGPALASTSFDEGNLNESYSAKLPGDFFVAGRRYAVEIDHANTVAESFEFDNRFPTDPTKLEPLNAAVVPSHDITFVPVVTTAGGVEGQVPLVDTIDALYVNTFERLPIAQYNLQVRAQPFSYQSGGAFERNWPDLLTKISELRALDDSDRFYHGILDAHFDFGDGVAGIAQLGSKAAVSLPDGATIAHEFGHNFGLRHAPCETGASADPNYPYEMAIINVYGYNIREEVILPPSHADFMSYCTPEWVSDWSFERMISFFRFNATNSTPQKSSDSTSTVQPSLWLSGVVNAQGTKINKAVKREMRSLKSNSGSHFAVGLDAFGHELFRQGFNLIELDHADEAHFHTAIPFVFESSLLVKVQIVDTANKVVAEKVNSLGKNLNKPTVALKPPSAIALSEGQIQVNWDPNYDSAIIRDLQTDNIIAIDSSGSITTVSWAAQLEITLAKGFDQHVEIIDVH